MKLEIIVEKAKIKKYKEPLLFVHGASVGAWMMQPFLVYFSQKGFDSYALSLRGHGQSEGHDHIDNFGLVEYVLDLYQTINSLDEKPILLGHSMGGAVVQSFLNTYHDLLDDAVLISSATANGIHKDSPLGMFYQDKLSFMRSLRKSKTPMTFETLLSKVLFSDRVSNDVVLDIRNQLTKESKKMSYELLEGYITDYSKIKTKVYVFGSKVDQAIPIESTIATAKAFDLEPLWLPDVCHFMTYDPNFENAANMIYEQIKKILRKKS